MHACASFCGLITLLTHVSDATLLLVSETTEQTSIMEKTVPRMVVRTGEGGLGRGLVKQQVTENEY